MKYLFPKLQPRRKKSVSKKSWLAILYKYLHFGAIAILVVWASAALAQSSDILEVARKDFQVGLDTLWVLFTGTLVFFMNAGFAMLETGFCRRQNATNVLAKNLIVFCLATVAFWMVGFGLMFGDGSGEYSFLGEHGFFLRGADNSPTVTPDYRGDFNALGWVRVPLYAKFFFQLTFAGTAATIVSGAVAERIRFIAFLLFSPLLVGFSYAITGHWVWGGGWLSKLGFWDFAGSTVVHSVGGWAGLVGTLLLKPRLKRYPTQKEYNQYLQESNGEEQPENLERTYSGNYIIPVRGHNLSLSTLGSLILWLGWFGFNAGSTLTLNPPAVSHILLTTIMAGAFGGIGATISSWLYLQKPSLAFIINGILGGCVSITASCAYINLESAAIIGTLGGVFVTFATKILDKSEIDDPVGAIPVHLVCGIWGTLAVGLFSVGSNVYSGYGINKGPATGLIWGGNLNQLFAQFIGIASIGVFTFVFSLITWGLISKLLGSLRVTPKEEEQGLDNLFAD